MKTRSIISASAIVASFLIAGAASAIDADSYYSLAGVDPLVYEANEGFDAADANVQQKSESSFDEDHDWTPIQ